MRKLIASFTALMVTSFCHSQIVGSSAYLQGQWVEVGINGNGSFGNSSAPPTGYHPHGGGVTGLSMVYDWGHDGWTTGSPAYMGDYTLPGSPFEGWELQVNGSRVQGYAPGPSYVYSGIGILSGAGISSYINMNGQAIAQWSGTYTVGSGNLSMNLKTIVDTNASWVTTRVTLRNIGVSTANNVYFFRSCDPDNDDTWPSGSMVTDNWVTYQNDSLHRVLVSAMGTGPHSYLGLGTIDSRAVAFIYNWWGLSVSTDLAAAWSQSPTVGGAAYYNMGAHHSGDIAIGLVFNVGNIPAGDSATLTYAYIFSDSSDLFPAVGPTGGTPSAHDSFYVITEPFCSGPRITYYNHHYTPGLNMKTFFGDGTSVTTALPSFFSVDTAINYALLNHIYPNSGTYTLKHVLFNGVTRLDSLVQTYHHVFCNTIPVGFFYDGNANCTQDSTEPYIFQNITTEIDSNGIAVDNISSTSGLYYTAYGSVGDVYTFRVLSTPAGMYVSCPTSGTIYDTLSLAGTNVHKMALTCSSSSSTDLQVFATTRAARLNSSAAIIVDNTVCPLTSASLSAEINPKFSYEYAYAPPTTIAGHTLSWNVSLSSTLLTPVLISLRNLKSTGIILTAGDTVLTKYTINPISGDLHPADNICIRNDTVRLSLDPNYISVSPEGYIPAGTELTYAIGFENTGNDTARNIHVMDTLSDNLDPSTFRMIAASAYMDISKIRAGGHTIMKFDFPGIMLPDSSHHGQCDGVLMYSVKTRALLPTGTLIPAQAGIYFDDNDPVETNTVTDIIAGIPLKLSVQQSDISIYPNPATNTLTIKADNNTYTSLTISNTLGQVVMQRTLDKNATNVSISELPAGMYYVTLIGTEGNVMRKFVKM